MSEWIKCSDRLPSEEQGTVAVLTRTNDVLTAWATYWHGARTDFACWTFPHGDEDEGAEVTHWTPLPELPRK